MGGRKKGKMWKRREEEKGWKEFIRKERYEKEGEEEGEEEEK